MEESYELGVHKAIEELITTYQALNGRHVTELTEVPSPIEFMQFVRKGRPCVIRGAASEWPATSWTVEYLENKMKDSHIKVAITPLGCVVSHLSPSISQHARGNADAIVLNPNDEISYFVKPLEVDELFSNFIHYIRDQELLSPKPAGNVKYSQAQNDNLRGEYSQLYEDVDKDIPWARIAFGVDNPDAINLWIGNSKSVTALHRDNYENIYCQMVGSKHFTLLPPTETACVNEQMMPCATYSLDASSHWQLSPEAERVPFSAWDPDNPDENKTQFSQLSRPLRVDLSAGDVLYLPALWYHKVSQSCSDQGICCAVNYWYDMDFEGMFSPSNDFIRRIATMCEA